MLLKNIYALLSFLSASHVVIGIITSVQINTAILTMTAPALKTPSVATISHLDRFRASARLLSQVVV